MDSNMASSVLALQETPDEDALSDDMPGRDLPISGFSITTILFGCGG
jgi:hypothetical protein